MTIFQLILLICLGVPVYLFISRYLLAMAFVSFRWLDRPFYWVGPFSFWFDYAGRWEGCDYAIRDLWQFLGLPREKKLARFIIIIFWPVVAAALLTLGPLYLAVRKFWLYATKKTWEKTFFVNIITIGEDDFQKY